MTLGKSNYYHGTSTIFLESIKTTGLGAINPNLDFKNLDVLRYLVSITEKWLLKDQEYLALRKNTLAMAKQTVIENTIIQSDLIPNFNFRHDKMHISLSRMTALSYCIRNKYGSEILERCIILITLLEKNNIHYNIPSEINLFNIKQYINIDAKPILIEIIGLEDEYIEEENGKNGKEMMNLFRDQTQTLNQKQIFIEELKYNFRILNPIESKKLRFYEIDYDGLPGEKNFDYTLSKV